MKYDIISVGSGLVDAFVDTGVKESSKGICFPSGTKIKVENIIFSVGGGGINSAASFSRLGLKTGFLGKVGFGNNADIILRELNRMKVDFIGVQTKSEHTGYSIVLETDKKHRTILTFKGSSDDLKFSEIKKKNLSGKWFHFTSMSGDSFETQNKIADYAVKNKIPISFNPSSYQVRGGINQIKHIVKNSFVITMNKEEAEELIGKKDPWRKLHNLGAEIVVITNGEFPGTVYDGKTLYKFYPNKIKAAECTGAGDSFSSGFVASYIKTKDIEKSIKIAMANAESVIMKRGANNGVLSWNEALKKIKKKGFRVEVVR